MVCKVSGFELARDVMDKGFYAQKTDVCKDSNCKYKKCIIKKKKNYDDLHPFHEFRKEGQKKITTTLKINVPLGIY